MRETILLLGGGGHCLSCIDVLEAEGRFNISGIIDNDPNLKFVAGYPVIGGDHDLLRLKATANNILITVGQIKTPKIRASLFKLLESMGYILPNIISPLAKISRFANLDEARGSIIMHNVILNSHVRVGFNCIINTSALIEHGSIIGENSHISTGAIINGDVTIGKGVFVGSGAVIMQGLKIEDESIVGMGAVLRKNLLKGSCYS